MKSLITFLLVVFAGSDGTAQDFSPEVLREVAAIQHEKSSRGPVLRKLSSQLIFLTREVSGVAPVAGAPELRSRLDLDANGNIEVEIAGNPGPELIREIMKSKGTMVHQSHEHQTLRAFVPPGALLKLAARNDVQRITPADRQVTHLVRNEADFAQRSKKARMQFDVNGSGISVGILSDSAKHADDSIKSGELPESFTILPGRFGNGTGEGTAMAEIIHDMAPGAKLFFAKAGPGKSGFAESIRLLGQAGCRIIVDDISYSNEWQFQDDVIGIAVNKVVENGALYISAAGNEGSLLRGNSTTWEGDFADGGVTIRPLPNGRVHQFGAENFNILKSGASDANLQWSDEYRTSANDYDLYVLNASGTKILAASNDIQNGNDAPVEIINVVYQGERLVVLKLADAAPRYVRLSCQNSPLKYATTGQIVGHAGTANCMAVAAANAAKVAPDAFTTFTKLQNYSSDGPHRKFYKPNGEPFTPGNFMASGGISIPAPALTGGDNGRTSVPGFRRFPGTSAAAPAVAAIAALVWSKSPGLSNTQVRSILELSLTERWLWWKD